MFGIFSRKPSTARSAFREEASGTSRARSAQDEGARAALNKAPRQTAGSGSPDAATVDQVLVPRSALASFARDAGDYDLVRAVVTFVETMLSEGLHTTAELPARAVQLYRADCYLVLLNAGGHRRMIHAVGGELASMLAGARTAFAAFGASTALDTLNRFTDWIAENPEEAARPVSLHDGAAGVPEELDRAIPSTAMADTMARAAAWISGWDNLVVVDDPDYADALRATALANPQREHRQIFRSIGLLQRQLADPVLAATGMVCAACADPEIRLAVEGPMAAEVEGRTEAAFSVRTNEAVQRLCVLRETGAVLFEQAPTPPTNLETLSEIEDMEQALATGRLPGHQLPHAGRVLAEVAGAKIDAAISLAERYRAPAAIDLLLRRAQLDFKEPAAAPAAVEPRPGGEAVTFLVAASGTPLFVVATPLGAALVRPRDMHTLVSASAEEISAHAGKATKGAAREWRKPSGSH